MFIITKLTIGDLQTEIVDVSDTLKDAIERLHLYSNDTKGSGECLYLADRQRLEVYDKYQNMIYSSKYLKIVYQIIEYGKPTVLKKI